MSSPVGFVVYNIWIDGTQIPDFPMDVEIQHGWGEHDICQIRIAVPKDRPNISLLKPWRENANVELEWGRYPALNRWFGYVNHHELSSEDDEGTHSPQITYTCIGTSKPMNTHKIRAWNKVSPTYIAKKIAKEYSLRAVLTKTPWMFDHEMQNESDFHFLNRIANKIGFKFWVSGGTLYFMDPVAVIAGARQLYIPKYRIDQINGFRDNAKNFRMAQGDQLPGAVKAKRTTWGIDPKTHVVYPVHSGSGSIEVIRHDWHLRTRKEGHHYIGAHAELQQFWVGAYVEVMGYPTLYPGKMVQLDGARLPDNMSGQWLVTKSHHRMHISGLGDSTRDLFTSHLEVVKNVSAYVPNVRGVNKVVPEIVGCVGAPGQWSSTSQNVIYEGDIT